MTDLANPPTPTLGDGLETAAALAARIPIPIELPPRYDGQRLEHLSASSYRLFSECPEAFRRRYIVGERLPKTAGMLVGSRVDDALSAYYRHQLEHHETLPHEEVIDQYHNSWSAQLEQDAERNTIVFDEFDETAARQIGADALKAALEQLVPQLGEPVAIQRRVELKLTPGVRWTILAYLDLETRQPQLDGGPLAEVVIDYKIKAGGALSQAKADHDPQASLYLATRWLDGQPAFRMRRYSTVTYPGQGFTRRGASFQGGVPSEARLTFRRRARSRSGRRPSAWVSPVPGPRRGVGVLDGLRRGV